MSDHKAFAQQPKDLYCPKHNSKVIFICIHNDCRNKLVCVSCIEESTAQSHKHIPVQVNKFLNDLSYYSA